MSGLGKLGLILPSDLRMVWHRAFHSTVPAHVTVKLGQRTARKLHYGRIHQLHWTNGAGSFAVIGACQSRRSMSILTDLLRRKKSEDDDEEVPEAKTLPLLDEVPEVLSDAEIQAKRNISRVNEYHQRLIHGKHPYTEPKAWFHHTVKYKQRMFGRYGESSGVNPGILWPTQEELQERIEYENICHPFTIQEMVERKLALRRKEQREIENRTNEVEAKMAMLNKFKEDLRKRHEAKEREASEAQARRDKLVEEVRRHFGYLVDSRDERFQELLEKKEKEQKKKMKEARKEEKQKKILEKLEGKGTAVKASKKAGVSNVEKD